MTKKTLQLVEIFDVDVRSSFADANVTTNEKLVKLQADGCEITEGIRIFERGSGKIIVLIPYKQEVDLEDEPVEEAPIEEQDGTKHKGASFSAPMGEKVEEEKENDPSEEDTTGGEKAAEE